MNKELFGQPYDENNPYWILESYFDRMYGSGFFVKAVSYMAGRNSFHVDGAYCSFPDLNSCYEEEHFEGVEFAYGYPPQEKDTIIVGENICYEYLKRACDKYLEFHPEDASEISKILKNAILHDV